jgi:hypothetical protein
VSQLNQLVGYSTTLIISTSTGFSDPGHPRHLKAVCLENLNGATGKLATEIGFVKSRANWE